MPNKWFNVGGIATSHGLQIMDFRTPQVSKKFSVLQIGPDWRWGLPSFPSSGYRHSLEAVKRPGLKQATHLHLVPRLRMSGVVLLPPTTPARILLWRVQVQCYFLICLLNGKTQSNLKTVDSYQNIMCRSC